MRRSFLIISCFLLLSAGLCAQSQTNDEQTNVNQTLVKFFDGLATLDMNLVKQSSTKDFILLENGAVWNMDTITNKVNQLKAINLSRINHLDFIQTEIKGNTAWVAYNNAADMTLNGKKINKQWLESAFLVKEGKDWKIRLLHSTSK